MFDCDTTADDKSKSVDVGDTVGLRVRITGGNMDGDDIGLAMDVTVGDIVKLPLDSRLAIKLG